MTTTHQDATWRLAELLAEWDSPEPFRDSTGIIEYTAEVMELVRAILNPEKLR